MSAVMVHLVPSQKEGLGLSSSERNAALSQYFSLKTVFAKVTSKPSPPR
jgi:hypothetical protein